MIIKVGQTVITRKWGSAKVELIEYCVTPERSTFLDAVDLADCNSDRWIFTLDNNHFAYGSQIAPVPETRDIKPEIFNHA